MCRNSSVNNPFSSELKLLAQIGERQAVYCLVNPEISLCGIVSTGFPHQMVQDEDRNSCVDSSLDGDSQIYNFYNTASSSNERMKV